MSLFDIIKYSGTDLNSQAELEALPEELLELYRDEVRHGADEAVRCIIYSIAEMAGWLTISMQPKQVTFNRALKRYNNDDNL